MNYDKEIWFQAKSKTGNGSVVYKTRDGKFLSIMYADPDTGFRFGERTSIEFLEAKCVVLKRLSEADAAKYKRPSSLTSPTRPRVARKNKKNKAEKKNVVIITTKKRKVTSPQAEK